MAFRSELNYIKKFFNRWIGFDDESWRRACDKTINGLEGAYVLGNDGYSSENIANDVLVRDAKALNVEAYEVCDTLNRILLNSLRLELARDAMAQGFNLSELCDTLMRTILAAVQLEKSLQRDPISRSALMQDTPAFTSCLVQSLQNAALEAKKEHFFRQEHFDSWDYSLGLFLGRVYYRGEEK